MTPTKMRALADEGSHTPAIYALTLAAALREAADEIERLHRVADEERERDSGLLGAAWGSERDLIAERDAALAELAQVKRMAGEVQARCRRGGEDE